MSKLPALGLVLLLAACTSHQAKAATRPAGAGQGKTEATVLIASGKPQAMPTIRAMTGVAFAAQGGVPLLRTDTMQVPEGAFLVLELTDNHVVVRVDEDLTMRVGDLALLGAPAPSASVSDQLDRLLTSEDRQAYRDRMIGWHISPAAANVPSIRREVEAKEKRDEVVRASAERAASRAEATAKDQAAPTRRGAAISGKGSKAKTRGGEPDSIDDLFDTLGHAPPAPKPAPPSKAPPAEPAPDEEAPELDAVGRLFTTDTALRACLAGHVASFGPRVQGNVTELELRYRLKGAALQLQLGQGLPTPACAQAWFDAHRAQLDATASWQTRKVPLK